MSSSIGQISKENFLNLIYVWIQITYSIRNNTKFLQTFISYTFLDIMRFKTENKYLLLESPILIYQEFNIDIKFTDTLK